MPKLLVFAPCAHAFTAQEDNSFSMIALLEIVEVNIAPGVTIIPKEAVVPTAWTIVTMWYQISDDEGKTFEQRIQIRQPDKQLMFESPALSFQMTERIHRETLQLNSFNISQTGEHLFQLAIREVGEARAWRKVAEYPILLAHNQLGEN